MMKKVFKYFWITWLVGFVLFNAITFLIPNEVFGVTRFDKPVFWVAYACITLALVAQLLTAAKFVKEDSKEKMFLNVPLLTTGYTAVILSLVVGVVFMIFPVLPTWLGAIVCLLVAGYFAVACVKASAAASTVSAVDEKIKTQTAFVRCLIVEAEMIVARSTTEEIKLEVEKVYEALKYSDPMSVPLLEELEKEIEAGLKELKTAVTGNDFETVKKLVNNLLLSIKERNSKCKLMK